MAQRAFEALQTVPPPRITVTITVEDPDVVAALQGRRPRDRERFAAEALKVGVLALRAAGGHVDAVAVREAGTAVVAEIHQLMSEQTSTLARDLTTALSAYFDPNTGTLPQRLDALVKRDGELERVLREQIGDNSVLAKTLTQHVGEGSDLFRILSPTEAEGLKAQIETSVYAQLNDQQERVLGEFSLDQEGSALRRLIDEITDHTGSLRKDLAEQIEGLVRELSFDQPDSALSRLRNQVDGALAELASRQNDFQAEVRETLAAQNARKKEERRSTRHGNTFEHELGVVLCNMAQRYGDIYAATGGRAGEIRSNKKGDHVIEIGPDGAAHGERIVWEAKEDKKWGLPQALEYLEEARKNRRAQIGVFVFSRKTAPDELDSFQRYGQHIVIVWDAEDPATDVLVQSAYTVARALTLESKQTSQQESEALGEIHRATRNIERQAQYLDEFRRTGEGIVSSAEKIVDRSRKMSKQLAKEIERLDEQLEQLRFA